MRKGTVAPGIDCAAFIGVINARLMPNSIQLWLRYILGTPSDQPMQIKQCDQVLEPTLLLPLLTYTQHKFSTRTRSHQYFLYIHYLEMIRTYCPHNTQVELAQWILDSKTYHTQATSHCTHAQENSSYLSSELLSLA